MKFYKFIPIFVLSIGFITSCNKSKDSPSKSVDCSIYIKDNEGNPKLAVDGKYSVYFFDETQDVPYVDVKSFMDLMYGHDDKNDLYTFEADNNTFKINSQIFNEGKFVYTASDHKIKIEDFDAFTIINDSYNYPLDCGNTKGNKYFQFDSTKSSYEKGKDINLDLENDYGIKTFYNNKTLYMPYYTCQDLLAPNACTYFNGKDIYFVSGRAQSKEEGKIDKYTEAITNGIFQPSNYYYEYSYNELCLQLDFRYGMKGLTKTFRSTDKDRVMLQGGAKEALKNYKNDFIDKSKNDGTFIKLFGEQIGDGGHSGMNTKSFYDLKPFTQEEITASFDEDTTYAMPADIVGYRARAIQEETFNYLETIGKTTVFTFDGFTVTNDEIEGKVEPSKITMDDLLIENPITGYKEASLKSFYLLNEYLTSGKGNESTHLVIDLSLNGGGTIFTNEFFTYYLTRGTRTMNYLSSVTGAKTKIYNKADINFDGKFDDKDYLPERIKTIDIICSYKSFSCGNTFPYVVSNNVPNGLKVNIIGDRAGGGTCAVEPSLVTPLGQGFQLSSNKIMASKDFNSIENEVIVTKDVEPGLKFSCKNSEDGAKFVDHNAIAAIINARQ